MFKIAEDYSTPFRHDPAQGKVFRVAIVGGGPGGLFSAWQLAAKAGTLCHATIFEASGRLGGKIITKSFPGAGLYEAGVAEIYDYSALGPDPLRELIEKDLKLEIKHIKGGACVLDGKVLPDADALSQSLGPPAAAAANAFRARCAELMKPMAFYKSESAFDNAHPWSKLTGEDVLEAEIADDAARRYVRVMSHSDVAAPPHLTSGLTLLKNVLMDVDGYMNVFSVMGGNEEIVRRLSDQLDAEVRLNTTVSSVEPLADGTYRLETGTSEFPETFIADYVILALPISALAIMKWRSHTLHRAVVRHVQHFDRPGHYVRATLLFKKPFWREHIEGAWWMLEAFDGCCVYDEGARHDLGQFGVLGFLIAGNAALGLANLSDDDIEHLCLRALPPILGDARTLLVDRRIHRWMASVNAIPGGVPERGLRQNHRPDPVCLPGIFLVGDYIFDATLNGVLDSSDAAAEMIVADILKRRRASRRRPPRAGAATASRDLDEVASNWYDFCDGSFVADVLRLVWDVAPGAKILVAGSGSAAAVAALRELGYDAVGFAHNSGANAGTLADLQTLGGRGDSTKLPFADRAFDVVLESCLCQVRRDRIGPTAAELRRVARRGVFLGSVVSDLAVDLIERHDLLNGVETLISRWEWSEVLFAQGFDLALSDLDRLSRAWNRALAANSGPGRWFEDSESFLFCFYSARIPSDETGAATKATIPVVN